MDFTDWAPGLHPGHDNKVAQTSDYCQTEAKDGWEEPDKSEIQNNHDGYKYKLARGRPRVGRQEDETR